MWRLSETEREREGDWISEGNPNSAICLSPTGGMVIGFAWASGYLPHLRKSILGGGHFLNASINKMTASVNRFCEAVFFCVLVNKTTASVNCRAFYEADGLVTVSVNKWALPRKIICVLVSVAGRTGAHCYREEFVLPDLGPMQPLLERRPRVPREHGSRAATDKEGPPHRKEHRSGATAAKDGPPRHEECGLGAATVEEGSPCHEQRDWSGHC